MQTKKLTSLSYTDKWHVLLSLFVVSLPFGTAFINICFFFICFFFILSLIKGEIRFTKKDFTLLLVIAGYYLFEVFTITYSQNIERAERLIFLKSYLFVFPLVLIGIKNLVTPKFIIKQLQLFSLSLGFYCLFSIFVQAIKFIAKEGSPYEFFFENNLSTAFVDLYFLAASLFISIVIVINYYVKIQMSEYFDEWYKKVYYPINSLLALTLILLNSRMLLFITFILLIGLTLLDFFKTKRKLKLIILTLILLIGFFNTIYNKSFNNKIKEALFTEEYQPDNWGGKGMRMLIWNCSQKVINENIVFGVGIGDAQNMLTLCYKIYMMDQVLFNGDGKNAHNIFLQIMVETGIVGTTFFLISFLIPLTESIKRNKIYIIFISIFVLSGLTESYLERNVTIAFFSYFNITIFLANKRHEGFTNS